MDKRAQELGEIKKEMEREDDALYAIKNKIRHLEDVEEDIHQARREMDDILYHMKEVWRGEHAEDTFLANRRRGKSLQPEYCLHD